MAIDLRYNERSARLEFLKEADDFPKWTNSDDMIRAGLRERISEEFMYTAKEGPVPLTIGKDRFADLIEALLDSRRVDPFKEYLDNLPAWDGERSARLLAHGMLSDRRHQTRAPALGVVFRAHGRGRPDLRTRREA